MSFFDTVADVHVDTMPVPSAPALDDAPAPDAAPVDNKKRHVCPTSEEEDDEGKVEEDKKEKDLFVGEFEEEVVAVTEACAKRPRAPLTVTKETILAAIERGDKDYLLRHCRTSKNTVNKLFANTRDSFATVAKNAAGRKRVMNATTLARAIYCFATAPTKEEAAAHHAVIEVLLKHCGVTVEQQQDDFLHFITVDSWQMARMIPEVPSDPGRPVAPLAAQVPLALGEAVLAGGPDLARRAGRHHEDTPDLYHSPQGRVLRPTARGHEAHAAAAA